MGKIREKLRSFWHWLWHSNSIFSWILLFVLAFLLVKYIFFPLAGFILHTKMPFVIVESYSMQHCNSIKGNVLWHCGFDEYWLNYGSWYIERQLDKEKFESFSFRNGLDAGDIIIIKGKQDYDVGDIIVFFANSKPIIHRIVNKSCEASFGVSSESSEGEGKGEGREGRDTKLSAEQSAEQSTEHARSCFYETKGDNNPGQLEFEKQIARSQIVGKAIAKIPKLGWVKLLPFKLLGLA